MGPGEAKNQQKKIHCKSIFINVSNVFAETKKVTTDKRYALRLLFIMINGQNKKIVFCTIKTIPTCKSAHLYSIRVFKQ